MACKQRIQIANHSPAKGFTLVEMAIAIVVTSIIVVTITPFLRTTVNSYMTVRLGKETMEAARIGFNRMSSEIRRIEAPTQFTSGSSTSFEFEFTNENDSTGDVEYYYDSHNYWLVRRDNWTGVTSRLVEAVTALKFTFYNRSGSTFTPTRMTAQNIWRIKLEMTVGKDEGRKFTITEEMFPKGIPWVDINP
jgi:prepilin-type N-terminal cleavage/methylation domain-containing protein